MKEQSIVSEAVCNKLRHPKECMVCQYIWRGGSKDACPKCGSKDIGVTNLVQTIEVYTGTSHRQRFEIQKPCDEYE
jgi:rRNA maturation endonuclease Nob1